MFYSSSTGNLMQPETIAKTIKRLKPIGVSGEAKVKAKVRVPVRA
jgi:hypothetical protein